jgi:hypothetical protein
MLRLRIELTAVCRNDKEAEAKCCRTLNITPTIFFEGIDSRSCNWNTCFVRLERTRAIAIGVIEYVFDSMAYSRLKLAILVESFVNKTLSERSLHVIRCKRHKYVSTILHFLQKDRVVGRRSEARIQTGALPAVGCADLSHFKLFFTLEPELHRLGGRLCIETIGCQPTRAPLTSLSQDRPLPRW